MVKSKRHHFPRMRALRQARYFASYNGRKYCVAALSPYADHRKACHELRIQDGTKTWRIVYHIDAEAIVILDVFSKTTEKTLKQAIATCKKRLQLFQSL